MYSFLRRPAWVGLHVVVLAIVVAFVSLGFWQLRRLDERQSANATFSQRLSQDPIVWSGNSNAVPPEYSQVSVMGEFRPEEEVLLRSQVNLGRPGFDILTPFYIDSTNAILVNRGWIPLELDAPPIAEAAPPIGVVTIHGFVRYPLESERVTVSDQTSIVARIDIDLLEDVVAGRLAPFYLEATRIEPSGANLPIVGPLPDLTDGPHLSYAVQWFAFASVSVFGYAALIRSTARRRAGLSRRVEPQRPLP